MLAALDTGRMLAALAPRLLVRNAVTSDAEDLAALHNAYAGDRGHEAYLSHMNMADWIAMHQTVRRPLWLACRADKPVAWLSFLGYFDRRGMEATAELGIRVRHDLRGQGIGRLLVSRAVTIGASLGFDRLVACIAASNDASLALFRGQGFEEWGRLPGVLCLGGQRQDSVTLGLALEPFTGSR